MESCWSSVRSSCDFSQLTLAAHGASPEQRRVNLRWAATSLSTRQLQTSPSSSLTSTSALVSKSLMPDSQAARARWRWRWQSDARSRFHRIRTLHLTSSPCLSQVSISRSQHRFTGLAEMIAWCAGTIPTKQHRTSLEAPTRARAMLTKHNENTWVRPGFTRISRLGSSRARARPPESSAAVAQSSGAEREKCNQH